MSAPGGTDHLCFIIHSHRPYCFDLNEILALPSGFRYRNRFDSQWIEPSLRADIEKVVGQSVLIVMRNVEDATLVPVRWGRVAVVRTVGNIVYFEYILSELVEYNTASGVRQQEILQRTDEFRAQHNWLPGPAGQALKEPSVFRSNVGKGLNRSDANDLSAWGNCVAAIATAQVYTDIEFLKIVGMFEQGSETAAEVAGESLVVKRNTVYVLRVFQSVPRPTQPQRPGHSIEVNTFQSHVAPLRAKQQAVGKYDMLTFVLKVLDLEPNERTSIEIPHRPDATTTDTALTSLYLPLQVAPAERARLAVSLVLIAVSLLLMFAPNLLGGQEELVRNIATVVFVLTLAGPSRTLSTVWPSWPWGVGR